MDKILKCFRSLKTTLAGILAGAMIILPQIQNLVDDNPETLFSMEAVIGGISTMLVGIAARDGDKSSEDIGIK